MSNPPAVEKDLRAPRACKRCGHLESVHVEASTDHVDEGCQVITGCWPGSTQMVSCDCEAFVPEESAT